MTVLASRVFVQCVLWKMKVIEDGHVFALNSLDGDGTPEMLRFVNRESGMEHPGTTTQEVCRALIQRTQHCDACLRWEGNDEIIQHFRMIIALHEARGMIRKADKGYFQPELVECGEDGHYALSQGSPVMPKATCDHIKNPVAR